MGRSITSVALVFAILLGLVSRVDTVVAHEHDGGEAAHHHDDLAYLGYAAHDAGHDHDESPADEPTAPDDDPDDEHVPGHSHHAARGGPILRRCGVAALSGHLLDVVACGSTGLALISVPSSTASIPSDARQPSPSFAHWPSETTLERRIQGLGLLY